MFFNKENEGSMKKKVYLCILYVRTYAHVCSKKYFYQEKWI